MSDELEAERNELITQIVLGGPDRRTANERFRYRLNALLDLHDVELALEERSGAVSYLAICAQCDPLFPQPFDTDAERVAWADVHVRGTGHTVIKYEEPR